MHSEAKERLINQFRAYLEAADGLATVEDQERSIDLFTLFGELSALKIEVKLESRQVRAAIEEFRKVFDTLHQDHARLSEELLRRREAEQAIREAAQRELLLGCLDLSDRLVASLESAHHHRTSLWLGLSRRDQRFFQAQSEGLAMTLRRLDDLLNRHGVRQLSTVGSLYDPHTMHAVEIQSREDQPEGTVLAELRKGFLHGRTLLRPAEVVVNKREKTS